MLSTQEIKDLVQQNIDQIKISEFVAEGGWPNLKEIDVAVFNQVVQQNDERIIKLHILYTLDRAGCCFIPGGEQQMRLPKKVIVNKNKVKFESYE